MPSFLPSELWTVLPVRGFADGKSRLAAALDPLARARLNRQLLATTLGVVAQWRGDLARCVVVSPCEEVQEMAARAGAATVLETPRTGGLNAAAALGAGYAREHGARSILVLACDLPHLTPDALAALARAAESARDMVIAPDRRGTGTNALLVSAEEPFEFRFGEGSCAAHFELAAERGRNAIVCARPELEFDLDTPEDLAQWRERGAEACASFGI